jgi:hypothetical protein
MSAPLPSARLACTQCGGELHPDEGQLFLTCPYCSASVYVDKSRVVFHWYVHPTLDEARARGELARWMAGNDTVKDLDRKSKVAGQSFQYFPVWYFKHRAPSSSQETVFLEPAAATAITECGNVTLPAGDLRRYEPDLDAQSQPPTVPLESALGWLSERRKLPSAEIVESALVHIPIYTFKYSFSGTVYTALVEGATGRTIANIFPAKAEAPYVLAGGLSAAVFLALAAMPVIGYLVAGEQGMTVGLMACGGLGLLAVPVLLVIAAWVAAKV